MCVKKLVRDKCFFLDLFFDDFMIKIIEKDNFVIRLLYFLFRFTRILRTCTYFVAARSSRQVLKCSQMHLNSLHLVLSCI